MAIVTIAKNLVNLLYPLRCASCNKDLDPMDNAGVCGLCLSRIRRNPKPYCISCGRTIGPAGETCGECRKIKLYFDRAYSACLYEGALKDLIHLFKYKGALRLAGPLLNLMTGFIEENPDISADIDLLTFVPLERSRLRQRGFNQSKTLAAGLSQKLDVRLLDTLEKRFPTRRQNELTRTERLNNLKGAFAPKGFINIKGAAVLLVDDVMTTGATLSECSGALKKAGAKEVRCITLARGS